MGEGCFQARCSGEVQLPDLLHSPVSFSAHSTHCFLCQDMVAKETMTALGHDLFCAK